MFNKDSLKYVSPLIILFLAFLYICSTWAWSAITVQRIKHDLAYWEKKPDRLDFESAANYLLRTSKAINLTPSDAQLYILKARLLILINKNSESAPNKLEINQLLRKALMLEPTSYLTWIRYSEYNDEVNFEQMLKSIEAALILGKYEYETMLYLVPLVFKHWDYIKEHEDIRNASNECIRSILAFKGRRAIAIIELAIDYDRPELITNNSSSQWVLEKYKAISEKKLTTRNKYGQ